MSKIDDLIKEHCPGGVEFKQLNLLFDTRNGYTPSKANAANWTNGTIPWFRMEDIRENGRILNDAIQHIPETAVKGGRLFPANSIIIATSATIGEHALITVPFISNQRFTAISLKPQYAPRFNVKFVYYYCFVLDEWCRNNTTKSSFSSVDMTGFKRFKFPMPPLEVQQEIVNTLDKFAQLEAELSAELSKELQARKKQYEYYRNELLSLDEQGGVKWASMADIANIYDGTHQTPKYTTAGVPFVSVENINAIYDTKKYISHNDYEKNYKVKPQADDVFMTRIGSIGTCTVVTRNENIAYYVTLALIRPDKSKVIPQYIKHALESGLGKAELRKHTLVNAVPIKINLGEIGKVKIPLPSTAEQSRIVLVLDKFETLLKEIAECLPSEIVARRKQYEYYRNKLLTFTELVHE